jgi:C-terminal processing protease CtpA/Prc
MYNTQLKVTISRYYTPSGRCIQALDYAHKDKNGAAIRTDEKNYSFKTRKEEAFMMVAAFTGHTTGRKQVLLQMHY